MDAKTAWIYESDLMREETGVPGENPRNQVEINWNLGPLKVFVVKVGAMIDEYASLTPMIDEYASLTPPHE